MLKYPYLVLDHDDTVVQSETSVNYPCFCEALEKFRPGESMTLTEYADGCFHVGFSEMCRRRFGFTEEELHEEFLGWKEYIMSHIPPAFPGIKRVILRQKALGGRICVVSHSSRDNITRDYRTHFGVLPDDIYGWDLPEELRKPSAWPLEQIMQKYGCRPEQMLVVDDMKLAWQMARGAGVKIAFADWGRDYCPELSEEMRALCDYSFATPQALEEFLFDGLTDMV